MRTIVNTLLFKESPYLAYGSLFLIVCSLKNKTMFSLSVLIFAFLLFFYRYEPFERRFHDNVLISPCEGTVINLTHSNETYYVAIFLSPFNRHYQIYPINGVVVDRKYDHTGKFNIVMDLNKSRFNEKKIHYIKAKNGIDVIMYQIAGFLPRMITSSDIVPEPVNSGEYLGMMKFGSRVDLIFPDKCNLHIKNGQCVQIGDIIASFN